MIFNSIPVAFPWYNNKNKQTFRKSEDQFNFPHILAPNNGVLPFMFRKSQTTQYPNAWKVYDLDDNVITDLSQYIPLLGAQSVGGFDYIYFNGNTPLDMGDVVTGLLDAGCYYMAMTFSGETQTWYSETFRIPVKGFPIGGSADYLTVNWSHTEGDIGPIYYPDSPDNFTNTAYFEDTLIPVEGEIEEIVNTDANNIPHPEFQRAIIRYRLRVVVPAFLKVALQLLPLHNNVTIVIGQMDAGIPKNIVLESSVIEGTYGVYNAVEILFEENLNLISKTCPTDMEHTPCPSLPAPGTLDLTLVPFPSVPPVANQVNLFGVLPSSIAVVDIYPTYSFGPVEDPAFTNVRRDQIDSGFLFVLPPIGPEPPLGVLVKLKSFNCIIGDYPVPLSS